jgi:hypothetical protein
MKIILTSFINYNFMNMVLLTVLWSGPILQYEYWAVSAWTSVMSDPMMVHSGTRVTNLRKSEYSRVLFCGSFYNN